MKDPIEIERQATEWLTESLKIIAALLAFAAFVCFLLGCLGAAIGGFIRVLRWAAGW